MLIFDLLRKDPALHAERLALAVARLGPKPDAFETELNSRKEATSVSASRPVTQSSKRSNERLTTLRYIRMAETEADLLDSTLRSMPTVRCSFGMRPAVPSANALHKLVLPTSPSPMSMSLSSKTGTLSPAFKYLSTAFHP